MCIVLSRVTTLSVGLNHPNHRGLSISISKRSVVVLKGTRESNNTERSITMTKAIRKGNSTQFGLTQLLLVLNLIVMISISAWMTLSLDRGGGGSGHDVVHQSLANFAAPDAIKGRRSLLDDGGIGSTDPDGFYFVHPKDGERDFYKIGKSTQTDKVAAPGRLAGCLKDDKSCTRPSCKRPECRPWGHHYDTIYQQRLGPYSRDDVKPFQFLEIGFFNGAGYDSVSNSVLWR